MNEDTGVYVYRQYVRNMGVEAIRKESREWREERRWDRGLDEGVRKKGKSV